jgi:hypothetical protein
MINYILLEGNLNYEQCLVFHEIIKAAIDQLDTHNLTLIEGHFGTRAMLYARNDSRTNI